ncbi:M4 family metallopeptidase [Microlunatus endophyticus]|uniref:M4 family metallopeptidase n=1 Tax=Microlunatus endophyticus TaxID=1716077 RepID=UPI001E56A44E|nr:M4 family metallopeptidase [Microlunatus endophyticus]
MCSIIPSYLLQRVVETSDRSPHPGERTLLLDEQLRESRSRRRTGKTGTKARTTSRTKSSTEPKSPDAQRTIDDAANSETLPGKAARKAGDPATEDPAVDEAWKSSAQIWDLYAEVFERQSVDGHGSGVTVTVHYGNDYDNAFWDGKQLVFGDGDGEVFERFTKPMDVMAHEFTHGVTQDTAGLSYDGQSGALNESVSDVFAAICTQRVKKQTAAKADWLIGKGIFVEGIKAKGLRSMKDPGSAYDDPRLGKDPQVGSMSDYVQTTDDNGGVHINSGIPNKAFQLAATKLGGHSWEQAGPIWYQALTGGEVTAHTDFAGFAKATVNAATKLYPDEPKIAATITAAWTEVGVLDKGGDKAGPPVRHRSRPVAIARGSEIAGRPGTETGESIKIVLDSAGPARPRARKHPGPAAGRGR